MADGKQVTKCVSCKINLTAEGAATFRCPVCGEDMGRCGKCRQQSNPYVCPKCGFQGP